MLRERLILPVEDWPELHQRLWIEGLRPRARFDPRRRRLAWSPATVERTRKSHGRWLSFLQAVRDVDLDVAPSRLVTDEAIDAFVKHLLIRNAPRTVEGRIVDIGRALRVMEPSAKCDVFSKVVRNLPTGSQDKRPRLRESAELLELGDALMAQALETELFPKERAVLYRDGLIISLLTLCPLRRSNFLALTIGENLKRTDNGWRIEFEPQHVKNKQPLKFTIPDRLVPHLETYLERMRPLLLAGRSKTDRLWISTRAQPLAPNTFCVMLKRRTKRAFGVEISPHLFRDCAATSLAIHDPEHVRAITSVLGHTSLCTSEKHYNQARTLDASRAYGKVVDQFRREARRTTKRMRSKEASQ